MDLLVRIKRLAIHHAIKFTFKAAMEAQRDGLAEEDVVESIVNATMIRSKRSTSGHRRRQGEMIHIIQGFTYDGILVYTKGVIRKEGRQETFYVLVSAKKSTTGDRE